MSIHPDMGDIVRENFAAVAKPVFKKIAEEHWNNPKITDPKVLKMLELLPKLSYELCSGRERGVMIESYRMPLGELRTIVLGLEALESPLL